MQFSNFRYLIVILTAIVLKTPRAETQLRQNFDLRALGDSSSTTNEVLRIFDNMPTLPEIFRTDKDAVNDLPEPLSYVGRQNEYLQR